MSLELKNKHSIKILTLLLYSVFNSFYCFVNKYVVVAVSVKSAVWKKKHKIYLHIFFRVSVYLSSWKQVHFSNIWYSIFLFLNWTKPFKYWSVLGNALTLFFFFLMFIHFYNRRYASNNDERNQIGKTIFA